MGARAPTLITGQLAPQRRQLPQLIERSAFVRSRRSGSSTVDQDIAAEPKIVAGAAKLVENGPRRPAPLMSLLSDRAHCWAQAAGISTRWLMREEQKDAERKRRKLLCDQANNKAAEAHKQEARACRAFQLGRCPIESCRASHDADPKTIWCCSSRVGGMTSWSRSRDKCKFPPDECPYKGHLTEEEQIAKRDEIKKQAEIQAKANEPQEGDDLM